jgi:hypothetical protein
LRWRNVLGEVGQITPVEMERFNGDLPPIRAFDSVQGAERWAWKAKGTERQAPHPPARTTLDGTFAPGFGAFCIKDIDQWPCRRIRISKSFSHSSCR